MPRFFVCAENIDKQSRTIFIEGDDARHIARSLRMAVGDELTVSDGEGAEYPSVLTKIRDERCELSYRESRPAATESPVSITLFMAYPKSDKLETVIQKATELGAAAIIPFESSRCIKRPTKDKAESRRTRLQRIAAEAAKQCGRARIPHIGEVLSFDEMLSRLGDFELSLFCYEKESTQGLKVLLSGSRPRTVSVIIGSEGGFSEEEASAAEAAGARLTGLGPRILRCETAPDYVLSAISYEFEL